MRSFAWVYVVKRYKLRSYNKVCPLLGLFQHIDIYVGNGLWLNAASSPYLTAPRSAPLPSGALSFSDMFMGRLKALGARVGSMPAKVRAAPKTVEGFYSSAAWRGLVADIKLERGARCQRPGCTTPTKRVIADHIVERKDGGADLDPSNIELLCFDHHQQKTAAARAARAQGRTWGGGSKV
jgi:5-methylcytosine-specific restriction protein A